MLRSTFPPDLVQAQRDYNRTYAALAGSCLKNGTVLRRRLLRLSVRLFWHRFWSTVPGRAPAARVELRRQVRAHERREAAAP